MVDLYTGLYIYIYKTNVYRHRYVITFDTCAAGGSTTDAVYSCQWAQDGRPLNDHLNREK